MAKSKRTIRKNEGKKNKPFAKPVKSKNGKLKQKATNMYNNKSFGSIYGSIKNESQNWGKRTRAMSEAALEGKPYFEHGSRKRPRQNKKFNKNNRKAPPPGPQFRLKMPHLVPPGQIPWWRKSGSKPAQKKMMKLLDEIDVNASSMSLLDIELEAFCKYVQLSANEIETRDNLISTIRNEAKERFGIQNSDVKVFGSYAARPVCTFESDVDLVIWGLVASGESEDKRVNEDRFQKESITSPQPTPEHYNTKKQSKNMKKQSNILKWKAAIDVFEKQLAAETFEEDNTNTDGSSSGIDQLADAEGKPAAVAGATADTAETSAIKEGDANGNGADKGAASLFVIDRRGCESPEQQDASAARATANKNDEDNVSPEEDTKVPSASLSVDSDNDTADKLEGLKNRESIESGDRSEFRRLALPGAEGLDEGTYADEMKNAIEYDDDEDDGEQEEALITAPRPKTRPRSFSLISLSSATTCSDNQTVDEDGLEVSFVTNPPSRLTISNRASKLSDDVRALVNSKLNQLSKRLRKAGVATSIDLRKWARVPILNMKTRYGYECDIGVGGHNGNDTSAYAGSQISQHPSFAPVVMVLKIILNQHDLDKPFTGGLGSFKLYVLVANHIQQHLANGGSVTPSEILMTFLYRYGDIRSSYGNVNPNARTNLMRAVSVHCHDGGVVEVSQVFQIENCITVFKACWVRLLQVLTGSTTTCLLRYVVDARRLQQRRDASNSILLNPFPHHRQTQSQLKGHVSSLVRYSTNHENKAISKLFKGGGGGGKPFKKTHRSKRRPKDSKAYV